MLILRIVQAKFGDCLILIYGTEQKPKYMLIDGGPGGVYKDFLKTELQKINASGGCLELMVLSHIDSDHIVGLIDLTEELKEQNADGKDPLISIKELWMNSFAHAIGKGNKLTQAVQGILSRVNNIQAAMPQGDRAFQSINQGNILRRNALLLDIPLNQITGGETISYNSLSDSFKMDSLSITVIGPNEENLNKLREEWEAWILKNENKLMIGEKEVLAYLDKSVPNLSSIMFLIEAEGKTLLFTGDGRGDFILEGLEKAKLLDKNGKIHLDVFKVPHHGSIRNASEDFFKRVTADKYVISGDGRHGNPEFESLRLIVEATSKQNRNIELLCTNKTDATKKLVKEYPKDKFGYKMTYLQKGMTAMDVEFF